MKIEIKTKYITAILIVLLFYLYSFTLLPIKNFKFINVIIAFALIMFVRNEIRVIILSKFTNAIRLDKFSFNIFRNITKNDLILTSLLVIMNSPIIVGFGRDIKMAYPKKVSDRKYYFLYGISGFSSYVVLIIISTILIRINYLLPIHYITINMMYLFITIFNISISLFVINIIPFGYFDMTYIALSVADLELTKMIYKLRRYNLIITIIFIYFLSYSNIITNILSYLHRVLLL